jgi:transcriptional regulator with XRE-family HTH domain
MFYICVLKRKQRMKLNRIKLVLVEKDLSQTWLAEKIGKSFSTVNAYCCNRQQPTLTVLQEIAKVLDVDMKDLISDNIQSTN